MLTISPVHNEDWRTEIISFLQGNCVSSNEAYNKRMEARTRPYVMIEGNTKNAPLIFSGAFLRYCGRRFLEAESDVETDGVGFQFRFGR